MFTITNDLWAVVKVVLLRVPRLAFPAAAGASLRTSTEDGKMVGKQAPPKTPSSALTLSGDRISEPPHGRRNTTQYPRPVCPFPCSTVFGGVTQLGPNGLKRLCWGRREVQTALRRDEICSAEWRGQTPKGTGCWRSRISVRCHRRN